MSAGSTNLTLQVSDICGQTQTGSLTVVVTNTVSLRLTHIVCLVFRIYPLTQQNMPEVFNEH